MTTTTTSTEQEAIADFIRLHGAALWDDVADDGNRKTQWGHTYCQQIPSGLCPGALVSAWWADWSFRVRPTGHLEDGASGYEIEAYYEGE